MNQQASPTPMTITQRYLLVRNLALIFIGAHNYLGRVWLCYGLGRQAATFGVMVAASLLPVAHAAFWAIRHDRVRAESPNFTNVAPVLLLFHPTILLIAYRKFRSRFYDGHSMGEGTFYLTWVFGGSDNKWGKAQCFLLLMAAWPCLAWSVPLAALMATTAVCMAIQEDLYRRDRRLLREAIRDAEIEGRNMMR